MQGIRLFIDEKSKVATKNDFVNFLKTLQNESDKSPVKIRVEEITKSIKDLDKIVNALRNVNQAQNQSSNSTQQSEKAKQQAIQKSQLAIERYQIALERIGIQNEKIGQTNPNFISQYDALENKLSRLADSNTKLSSLQKDQIQTQLQGLRLINAEIMKNAQEEARIGRLGTQIGTLPQNNNMFQNNQVLQEYVKNLVGADATITKFQRTVAGTSNDQAKFTVTTKDVNNNIRQEQIVVDQTTNAIYKQSEAIRETNVSMANLSSGFKNALGILTSYVSATALLYKGIKEVREGIGFINELNKAQTNIRIVTGESKEEVEGLTKQYSQLATSLHSTTSEMTAGAESFLRAGKTGSEVTDLLKASTIGAKLSGQETKEVSEQLIANLNGFKLGSEEAIKVVDTLTTIDNNLATSFAEVSEGMTRASSSAGLVGVNYQQLASYIGVVSSVTRKSADSIGESFNNGRLVA